MDISVNKVVKSFLRSKFTEWYSDELAEQFDDDDDDTTIDLSTATIMGGKWIVQLYEHLTDRPHIIVHEFRQAEFYSALGLLDDDDNDILDYTTTDDSDIDDKIEELMEPSSGAASKHLSVATIYSDAEEETERVELYQEPSGSAASENLSIANVYSDTEEETESMKDIIIISNSEDDL